VNERIVKKPALDLGSLEEEIQCRLQRGKIKLLIGHTLAFLLTMAIIIFVI
jgi:hypothetical protein